MGGIDLDPASSKIANETVNADEYYDLDANGLSKEWYGNVWLNPPGGRLPGVPSLTKAFWNKLMRSPHLDQAIFLAFSMEALQTCQPTIGKRPICIPDKRISFIDASGQPIKGNTHGSAFIYVSGFLDNTESFIETFSQFGSVYLPSEQNELRSLRHHLQLLSSSCRRSTEVTNDRK